jgi:LuxR family transcriptional regulator, maltose regulon positive regulatory protein
MTVADVPFDLVEAKLGAPTIRPGTVAKQDVIERLRASRLPFATVIAPAGYGKTTLLAEWSERDPRPFAWVALGRVSKVIATR